MARSKFVHLFCPGPTLVARSSRLRLA